MANDLATKEIMVNLKGRTIAEASINDYAGYSGVFSSVQLFLDNGVAIQIQADTIMLDQYDRGTPCLQISEHRL